MRGVAVAVLGRDRLPLAQELPRLQAVGVAAEVVVHRAGLGDRVEGRVDDRVAHPTADDVVLAARRSRTTARSAGRAWGRGGG